MITSLLVLPFSLGNMAIFLTISPTSVMPRLLTWVTNNIKTLNIKIENMDESLISVFKNLFVKKQIIHLSIWSSLSLIAKHNIGQVEAVGPVVLEAVLCHLQHRLNRHSQEEACRVHALGRSDHRPIVPLLQVWDCEVVGSVQLGDERTVLARDEDSTPPVGLSLYWYFTLTLASLAFWSSILLPSSLPTHPMYEQRDFFPRIHWATLVVFCVAPPAMYSTWEIISQTMS